MDDEARGRFLAEICIEILCAAWRDLISTASNSIDSVLSEQDCLNKKVTRLKYSTIMILVNSITLHYSIQLSVAHMCLILELAYFLNNGKISINRLQSKVFGSKFHEFFLWQPSMLNRSTCPFLFWAAWEPHSSLCTPTARQEKWLTSSHIILAIMRN